VTSPLLDPRHCVSHNLHQTARAVSRIYAEELRSTGVGRSQFAILQSLSQQGPLGLSELAEGLYMDRTTLSRNLKPLEKAGLVRRTPSSEDARVKLVTLTPAGRARLKAARVCWRRAQTRLLELLGEDAWRSLEGALRELRHRVR